MVTPNFKVGRKVQFYIIYAKKEGKNICEEFQ